MDNYICNCYIYNNRFIYSFFNFIKKVKFYSGFPDGYYLDIYDLQNECHHKFEDNHKDSEIIDFRNKYL